MNCINEGWKNGLLNTQEGYENWLDINEGFAYGLKGSYLDTSCAIEIRTMNTDLKAAGTSFTNIGSGASILDPFYKSQTAGIAFSNAMTACQFTTAATKIHLRLSPTGTTDLAYLLINVIKEGFFQKMNDQTIKNQIWDSIYQFL